MENEGFREKKHENNKSRIKKKSVMKGLLKLIISVCYILMSNNKKKTFKRIMSHRLHRIPMK